MQPSRSWLIGGASDCDLVVDQPTVSGHHCRLTCDRQGFSVRDLGSTNGTYVNGQRLGPEVETPVRKSDRITLGQTIPLPWPDVSEQPPSPAPDGAAELKPKLLVFRGQQMVLGRNADCDVVVDSPTVSGRHARLIRNGVRFEVEDLGSSNGTFLNGFRVEHRAPILPGDEVALGQGGVRFTVQLEEPATSQGPVTKSEPSPVLTAAPAQAPGAVSDKLAWAARPIPEAARARATRLASQPWSAQFLDFYAQSVTDALPTKRLWALRLATLIVPIPLAVLVVIWHWLVDVPLTLESWQGFVSTFSLAVGYGLVLGPLLFGLISPLPELFLERSSYLHMRGLGISPSAYRAARLAGLLPVCLIQVAIYEAIVYAELGLRGPIFLMLIVLGLIVCIGLTVAVMLATWPGRLLAPLVGLSLIWLVMIVAVPAIQGSEPYRSAARLGSSLTPLRWGHEALLLLESNRQPTRIPEAEPDARGARVRAEAASELTTPAPIDIAEPLYHAATERMGPRSDALALAMILIALVGFTLCCLPFAPLRLEPHPRA